MKGPPDKKRMIEASAAHQIFGRAGRPQFDTQGHVFVLAHEDDVKIARWREQYDQIPEDTKDPGLLKAKKALKRKMPHRRENEQYWNEAQFQKLVAAPPGKLYSRGPLPWRLLAYMLDASPEIDIIRRLVGKRLMDPPHLEAAQRDLERMLLVLHRAGYVRLEPAPPEADGEAGEQREEGSRRSKERGSRSREVRSRRSHQSAFLRFSTAPIRPSAPCRPLLPPAPPPYRPVLAHPTEHLAKLALFRSVNPLYGVFLVNQLGIADRKERIQAFESVLDFPAPVAPLRPRAEAGVPAAGPAGDAAAGPAVVAARPGHRGRAGAEAEGGRGAVAAAAQLRRRAGRRAQVGAQRGREAAAAVRLRVSGRLRSADPRRSGRPASCSWSSTATSTSTSAARTCRSRRASSSAICCG